MLDRSIHRRVLICSSDKHNPQRQAYRRGEEALQAVCQNVGITEFATLNCFSEFYRLRTRGPGDGPTLNDWWTGAQQAASLMMEGCDLIVTHNEWGEYGHMDHLLVRRMVQSLPNRPPMAWTDAFVKTTTWPVADWNQQGTPVEGDAEEFQRLKDHYVSRNCWTWSSEEPLHVNIINEMDARV